MEKTLEEELNMLNDIGNDLLALVEAIGHIPPNSELEQKIIVFLNVCMSSFSKFYGSETEHYQVMHDLVNPRKLTVKRYAQFVEHIDAIFKKYKQGLLKIIPSSRPDLFSDGYIIIDDDFDSDNPDYEESNLKDSVHPLS
jgi:hypothetical protein